MLSSQNKITNTDSTRLQVVCCLAPAPCSYKLGVLPGLRLPAAPSCCENFAFKSFPFIPAQSTMQWYTQRRQSHGSCHHKDSVEQDFQPNFQEVLGPTIPGQDVIKFTHMFPSITVRSILNSVRSWLRMTPNVSKLQR